MSNLHLLLKTSSKSARCCGKGSVEKILYGVVTCSHTTDGEIKVLHVSNFYKDIVRLAQNAGTWETTITALGLDTNEDFLKQLHDLNILKRKRRIIP